MAVISFLILFTACIPDYDQYGLIDGGDGEKPDSRERALYVAGIDSEEEQIILFKNSERVLAFPYGDKEEISQETDMNHLIEGHIYSVYISNTQTIVKKDGEEMFRYNGRETIKGIFPLGDNLFTLGQKCGEEGFSYRRNGKAILSRDVGQILGGMYDVTYLGHGALYRDDDSICFSYFTSSTSAGARSGVEEWHIVKDGKDHTLSLPGKTSQVYDLRLVGGTVCYVSQDNYSSEPILHIGTQEYDFNFKKQTPGRDYRLECSDGNLRFYGSYSTTKSGKKETKTCCWTINGQEYALDGAGYTIYSSGDDYCYVQYSTQQITISSHSITKAVLSGKYDYYTCWNGALSDGIFRIVLSPSDKNKKPFLWEEGKITEYEINGSLFGVEYY